MEFLIRSLFLEENTFHHNTKLEINVIQTTTTTTTTTCRQISKPIIIILFDR